MKTLLILIMTAALSVTLFAKSDEVDFMSLATLMLHDGHIERANDALNQVDVNDTKLDLARYHMLRGIVYSKKTFYKEANEHLEQAIVLYEAEEDPKKRDQETIDSLYLYLAQNKFKMQDYRGCVDTLDNIPHVVEAKPQLISLKAECYWRINEKNKALVTLRMVTEKFPNYYDAYKQRFYYLVSEHLYQAALDDAQIYLKNAEPNEKITLAFINALRESGQVDRAIELAEVANLRYLKSAEITVMLAHLYIDKDMIQSAAELFNEASIEDGKFTNEAAEMYRRAGDYVMALLKNTEMLDTKEKYKQRIAIFLQYGDFERVIVTRKAMERSGLMEDENMRYALAYAYYMEGDFDETEAILETLTKPDLFRKATELRSKMEKCKNNIWECQQ